MNLLTYQNTKLKQQFIFDLPVRKAICGRQCPGCYALKAEKRFPAVLTKRNKLLESSKQPNFSTLIVNELLTSKRSVRTVRIHSSGEFYSQEYIDKWTSIATQLPQFTFYAFTKRLTDFDFSHLMSLPNVVIIDSLMYGKLNYAPANQLLPNVFTCPSTLGKSVICGISCRYCMSKSAQTNGIQFVKH